MSNETHTSRAVLIFLSIILCITVLNLFLTLYVMFVMTNKAKFNFRAGDTYRFGKYHDSAITWLVLDVDDENNRALLITKNALFERKFDDSSNSWPDSNIYKYLNGSNSPINFSEEEAGKIYTDPERGRIFLLSTDEAGNSDYFADDDARKCNFKGLACYWWLRSSGNSGNYASVVSSSGKIDLFGDRVSNNDIAIRPALWINP